MATSSDSNSLGEGTPDFYRQKQGDFVQKILPVIEKVIRKLPPTHGSVSIADMGCTSGSDTMSNANFILKCFQKFYDPRKMPEFKAYFQDVAGTDISLLFHRLTCTRKAGEERPYYCLSVPGSIYGPEALLPCQNLHFVLSSFALDWLSKIPPHVSIPIQKGHQPDLWTASYETILAYGRQAREDLTSFLAYRAWETVHGAPVVLVFGIRKIYYPYYIGLAVTLEEMVFRRVVSHACVDGHDIVPDGHVYYRTMGEVDEVLARFKEDFREEKRIMYKSGLSEGPPPPWSRLQNALSKLTGAAPEDILEKKKMLDGLQCTDEVLRILVIVLKRL